MKQLDEKFSNKSGNAGIIDFGTWLHYYAFDVIGELTFSKRLGFIDNAKDIDGIIGKLEHMLDYFAVVRLAPRNMISAFIYSRKFLDWPNAVAGSIALEESSSALV